MKKANFSVKINAPKEKVWETLWNDKTYREWTNVFSEGSHAVSDWKEGSQILFLGPDGGGMFSRIEKMVPNETMEFKHLGMAKDGEKQPSTEETKAWEGSMENYYLSQTNGTTDLKVVLDIAEDHEDFFKDAFPKALQKVKEIAEAN